MSKSFQTRIAAVALAVVTLAACVLAVLNFSRETREGHFELPTDGVRWSEVSGGLQAMRVPQLSPAWRAGVRKGDVLVAANGSPTPRMAQLERQLFRAGSWGKATYTVERSTPGTASHHTRVDIQVIPEPTDRSVNQGLRIIALVYLCIGLYVLFRRWTAPKAMHFYIFCLASFVLYAFHYTGEFDGLDWTFYWGNVLASAVQPALFLHFAVTFGQLRKRTALRLLSSLLYVPAMLLVGLQLFAIYMLSATEALRHRIDQIGTAYLASYYIVAAVIFFVRYHRNRQPLERQQLKWLSRGTLLSVIPFTIFYVVPYLWNLAISPSVLKVSGFALVFLPLTFAWAIVRYRLMDTDLIFKRGVTYTLATAALVAVYFGVVGVSAEVVHTRLPSLRIWGLLAAIVATALIFEPIKVAIQAWVDRIFDRKRVDYRETLIDFSRRLSTDTDLASLSQSIVQQLSQTLLVSRVAVFLAPSADHPEEGFRMIATGGISEGVKEDMQARIAHASFLRFDNPEEGHRFFENPQQVLHLPGEEHATAAMLDMIYFLPCRVAQRGHGGSRPIAVIGLGRTQEGDFLSSEDMELLESLAGYIGIAIQNAMLFQRLESKISEFERLKEFNENIVESIKVGIATTSLDDRVESWNSEMEVMYALSRAEAIGKPFAEVFPAALVKEYEQSKSESGTHHVTKTRLAMHSGETRTANIAIAPLLTRDFISVGRILLVEDITDRTELEAQLTQAEKLSSIGILAAGVAHEVNTPLAVISSYAQMLTKQAREDAKLAMVLEKITQQTFRASEIVNGLLNFSRKTTSALAPVNLNSIVKDTGVLLEHQFRASRVSLSLDLDEHLPTLNGSQGKLQQVLLNLMMNAKDAMQDREQPRLFVKTWHDSDRILVSVSDNGSGIDAAHMHRIYDPFFTTKIAPREGQHKGTGLGLAVSYGIVQEHGGHIRVDSAIGKGTTFTLDFPKQPVTNELIPETTLHA